MITTQDFLARVDETPFSDAVKQEVHTMLAGIEELTPELHEQVIERLEQEIDDELKDVPVDQAAAAAIEQEVSDQLDLIDRNATAAYEQVESRVRELEDEAKRAEILNRLHS